MWFFVELALFTIAVIAVWEFAFRGGFAGYRAEAARFLNEVTNDVEARAETGL